jgi:hypothetical protein
LPFFTVENKIKLPTDTNIRAESIIDSLTSGNKDTTSVEALIKAAAAALDRKSGLKGQATNESLTAK